MDINAVKAIVIRLSDPKLDNPKKQRILLLLKTHIRELQALPDTDQRYFFRSLRFAAVNLPFDIATCAIDLIFLISQKEGTYSFEALMLFIRKAGCDPQRKIEYIKAILQIGDANNIPILMMKARKSFFLFRRYRIEQTLKVCELFLKSTIPSVYCWTSASLRYFSEEIIILRNDVHTFFLSQRTLRIMSRMFDYLNQNVH